MAVTSGSENDEEQQGQEFSQHSLQFVSSTDVENLNLYLSVGVQLRYLGNKQNCVFEISLACSRKVT